MECPPGHSSQVDEKKTDVEQLLRNRTSGQRSSTRKRWDWNVFFNWGGNSRLLDITMISYTGRVSLLHLVNETYRLQIQTPDFAPFLALFALHPSERRAAQAPFFFISDSQGPLVFGKMSGRCMNYLKGLSVSQSILNYQTVYTVHIYLWIRVVFVFLTSLISSSRRIGPLSQKLWSWR